MYGEGCPEVPGEKVMTGRRGAGTKKLRPGKPLTSGDRLEQSKLGKHIRKRTDAKRS